MNVTNEANNWRRASKQIEQFNFSRKRQRSDSMGNELWLEQESTIYKMQLNRWLLGKKSSSNIISSLSFGSILFASIERLSRFACKWAAQKGFNSHAVQRFLRNVMPNVFFFSVCRNTSKISHRVLTLLTASLMIFRPFFFQVSRKFLIIHWTISIRCGFVCWTFISVIGEIT